MRRGPNQSGMTGIKIRVRTGVLTLIIASSKYKVNGRELKKFVRYFSVIFGYLTLG